MYTKFEKAYLASLSFYLVDLLFFLGSGKKFLHSVTEGSRSLFFVDMNYIYAPNIYGHLFSTVCGGSFFFCAIYLFRKILKENKAKQESLILLGILVSCVGLINDSILGSGLFYLGFPLSFMSCIFELTRFSNHLSFQVEKRVNDLSGEVSSLSRVAHLGLTQGRIMHDTNNNLANIDMSARVLQKFFHKEMLDGEKVDELVGRIKQNVSTITKITRRHKELLYSKKIDYC